MPSRPDKDDSIVAKMLNLFLCTYCDGVPLNLKINRPDKKIYQYRSCQRGFDPLLFLVFKSEDIKKEKPNFSMFTS
jgi:hypothetical protein